MHKMEVEGFIGFNFLRRAWFSIQGKVEGHWKVGDGWSGKKVFWPCLGNIMYAGGTLELQMTFRTKLFMPKLPSARRSSMVWKI
ncbi:hypothetical protein NC651_020480 [Populus alba x Populus x berolinensis]|nr:hypothetical protein NC651_020480 [Populus alba x Populus x berolinensis]